MTVALERRGTIGPGGAPSSPKARAELTAKAKAKAKRDPNAVRFQKLVRTLKQDGNYKKIHFAKDEAMDAMLRSVVREHVAITSYNFL